MRGTHGREGATASHMYLKRLYLNGTFLQKEFNRRLTFRKGSYVAPLHSSVHYFWLLVLPHYIFLKCYNFLLFKIFFTKGIDINSLQTQEFVYTWLVKIFIN
jgi:hypothetical protein